MKDKLYKLYLPGHEKMLEFKQSDFIKFALKVKIDCILCQNDN